MSNHHRWYIYVGMDEREEKSLLPFVEVLWARTCIRGGWMDDRLFQRARVRSTLAVDRVIAYTVTFRPQPVGCASDEPTIVSKPNDLTCCSALRL